MHWHGGKDSCGHDLTILRKHLIGNVYIYISKGYCATCSAGV